MKVILDTCVLSELNRERPSENVRHHVEAIADEALFISAVTIGEITKGISLLETGERQQQLQSWLSGLESHYGEHILGFDAGVARLWGELTAKARRIGRVVQAADGIIAATAIYHGCHVMTRNVSGFEPTGALIINPW
jgi:predicted nucleic acid-binding protein